MAGKNKKREYLIFIFQYIMKFLSKENFTFILFYGSLLGYLRDGNFIDNDDDIDVLMDRKDINKLMTFLQANNYKGNKIEVGIYNKNIVQLYFKKIGPLDIYFVDINEKHMYLKHEKEMYDIIDIFPLKKITLYDIPIYIPNESEKIILKGYGENWINPLKKGQYIYTYSKEENKENL